MKSQAKRWLSILLATIFIVSAVPLYSAAEEEPEEVTSGSTVLQEYDSPNGEGAALENDDSFVEGDPESVELEEGDVLNNLNITYGAPESAAADETDGEIPAGTGETDSEAIEEFKFEGDTKEETAENKTSGSGYETNAGSPYLTLSSTNITINTGSSTKVTVGYGGYSGYVYLQYYRNNSNVNCSWGSWSNGKNPLTVTGMSAGSTTITVYLKASSNNKTLATKTINVKINNSVQLSLSKTSLDTVYGKTTSVGVTVSGANSSMKIRYSISSGNSISCSWGSWSGRTIPLYIKGTGAGISKVTVAIISSTGSTLKSATLSVYVTRSASLSVSSTSFSIAPGQKHTNTISYSGAYGSIYLNYSISNSRVACSWSGWSGNSIKLYTTGKTAGSSTITVRMYNSSNDLLASRTISVSTDESPQITCNVSSLSATVGETKKIWYTFSGTTSSVYFSYSIANSSICSANWYGSWSGNSHALTVYAKGQGTTTLTVYLKNANTNATLASKTITVSFAGQPEITLSVSSVSVKVGAQASLTATAKNISGSYSMSYGTSGSNFSAAWTSNIKNNQASLSVKGTKSGSGKLTVYLKNSAGTVVSQKTINVTTAADENPKISFSKSSVSVKEKDSTTVTVSYSGTTDSVYMTYSLSNSNCSASWGNWSSSSIPLTIKGGTAGSTSITIYLKRVSNNKVLAQGTISVSITPDTSEISKLSYSFDNYTADIPLSTFKLAFGNNTKAERLHQSCHYAGGVCYGMAATSMLYRADAVTTSSFGKSSIWNLSKSNKNSSLGMNVSTFIEMMYITQFSTLSSSSRIYNLNEICSKVAAGNRVEILIFGPGGGHALVGYKLDTANKRLYVYDCNHPGSERYITLSGSYGNYTGWSYNLFGSTTWNSSNGYIGYQAYSSIKDQWDKRGKLTVNSSWISNASLLMVNSSQFEILDVDDNVIATYSDGTLSANTDEILEIKPMSYNPYEESDDKPEYNLFYLPTDYYLVKNKDETIDEFKAEMIDEELGVVVKTEADEIAFGVDDSFDLCSINLGLDAGELYDVMLLTSREGENDIQVVGMGMEEFENVGLTVMAGVFTSTNAESANVTSLGDDENVSVRATATEGGKITPEGSKKTMRGADLTYSIVPDAGYEIADVIVNEESVGIVNEYTFVQVDKDSTIQAVFAKIQPNAHVSVKKPSVSIVKYGDTLMLHAEVDTLPEGAHLEWSVSGSGVKLTPSEDGMTCGVTSVSSGKVTVIAKIIDADGSEHINADGTESKTEQSLTSKAGFLQKLISFFKNLFRIGRIIAQAVKED